MLRCTSRALTWNSPGSVLKDFYYYYFFAVIKFVQVEQKCACCYMYGKNQVGNCAFDYDIRSIQFLHKFHPRKCYLLYTVRLHHFAHQMKVSQGLTFYRVENNKNIKLT